MTLPLPPAELRFMNEDDEAFAAIGDAIVLDMIELCALSADSAVLDVGSGYGRVAHALARREFEGVYLGLEILPRHVTWCQGEISAAAERYALDETWREAQLAGACALPMGHVHDAHCRYHNPEDPLHAIGFTPSWIHRAVAAAGLRVYASRLGSWCARPGAHDAYQDAYVIERRA
jgi:SAM-dependent methyltransferase